MLGAAGVLDWHHLNILDDQVQEAAMAKPGQNIDFWF
jgi:hypothetical protein